MNKQVKGWLFISFVILHDVLCVHQWRLTDDGKKIEAVVDSPFDLNYPGSLAEFLKQAESVKLFGKTYHELSKTLKSITKREKLDEPDIENRVKKDNPHCQRVADIKLTKDLFKSTYSLELCKGYTNLNEDYLTELKSISLPSNDEVEPLCSKYFAKSNFQGEKELGIKIFDMKLKGRLPDIEYSKILGTFLDGRFKQKSMKTIGSYLGKLIAWTDNKEISHHPYLHIMAAAYWRSAGQVNDALDCYRTARTVLKTGNHDEDYRSFMEHVIHVAAATLLNYADKPDEAATLITYLGDTVQPLADPFCRLTLLHAVTADCLLSAFKEKESNMSIQTTVKKVEFAARDYAEAIHIETQLTDHDRKSIPGWDRIMETIIYKHDAISCQLAVTTELEHQRENLEQLLTEKLHYNEVYGTRLQNEDQIVARMVTPEIRQAHRLSYEMWKYGWNPHRDCLSTISRRFIYSNSPNNIAGIIYCDVKDQKAYDAFFMSQRKATLSTRLPLNDTAWRIAELYPKDRNFEKKVKTAKEKYVYKPSLPKKYPLQESQTMERYWRRTDWPNSMDCQGIISKIDIFNPKNMPQVFIPLEDKGYIISELLTKILGFEHNEDHPFPWNEPFCETFTYDGNSFSPYSSLRNASETQGFDTKYADQDLKPILSRLAEKQMDTAEVGQRIRTLLKNDIGPRWLVLNLAALYWRMKGYPSQAIACLVQSVHADPNNSDVALIQIAQVVFKATGSKEEALEFLNMAAGVDKEHPFLPWLQGRLELFANDVDGALYHLKEALDKNPNDRRIAEDLLKVACSGKSTKPAISSRYPTVCCSPYAPDAVCVKRKGQKEECYVVDLKTSKLVYSRCNGVYTGLFCYPTSAFVQIISPFLPIFQTIQKREIHPFVDDAGAAQTVEMDELPLDYGGTEAFFAPRSVEWWSRSVNEMKYTTMTTADQLNEWTEDWESSLAAIPPKPLSFLWIKNKSEMLDWDVKLPENLPIPTLKQVRKGIEIFPIPRKANTMCNGVKKLSILLEKQTSTWVSVTAKGIDIEKYVDLRGPVPGIAGLQPVCNNAGKIVSSPVLGLDHIPIFALSDQFLFYKPEKMLTDSLKSLGNERDSIEHVAARLHTAMMANSMGKHASNVNWLLCVLSSLYWRVIGDAPRAVGCLQCALQTAPPQMRDVALVSLANIAHQAGLLHSALIVAGAALSVSPNLVAIHFAIANIYASSGDYQRALYFYYSTLALQHNFDPAKERIRAIICHSDEKFTFTSL